MPAPTHIEPHVERVTMHPAIIGAARHVLVVATGDGKAERSRRSSATSAIRAAGRPSSPGSRRPTWILDEAAAAGLAG